MSTEKQNVKKIKKHFELVNCVESVSEDDLVSFPHHPNPDLLPASASPFFCRNGSKSSAIHLSDKYHQNAKLQALFLTSNTSIDITVFK